MATGFGFFSPARVKGTSGYTQNTIVINDFGLERKDRTSKRTGKTKSRFSISIDATPLVHHVDAAALGKGPAEAMAEYLKTKMRAISAPAAESTKLRREVAARAFDAGNAGRRYSVGRMKVAMRPDADGGGRLFNDSGRFAESIIARPARERDASSRSEWIVNVAANRLDPSTFHGGVAALSVMYLRLVALVPEFGDSRKLMDAQPVKAALVDAYRSILQRNEDLRSKLAQAQMRVFAQVVNLLL